MSTDKLKIDKDLEIWDVATKVNEIIYDVNFLRKALDRIMKILEVITKDKKPNKNVQAPKNVDISEEIKPPEFNLVEHIS